MNISLSDELLCTAARQMAASLAASLPEEGEAPSAAFAERMAPLLHRMRRRRTSRIVWHRAAAALLTVVLALGVVLAASPVARAAVSRWFLRMTELATVYRIAPADSQPATEDYAPTAPAGYVLNGDYTGAGDGIRVMRLYYTETGQRPMGSPGSPQGYEMEDVTVHGLSAQLYRIAPAETAERSTQRGFGLWFYRGEDPVHFHHVAVPEGGTALLWVDERANCLFLLMGGMPQDQLLSTAESVYTSERS